MTERTTIGVRRDTKELLDGRRGGQPWDEFLREQAGIGTVEQDGGESTDDRFATIERELACLRDEHEDLPRKTAEKVADELPRR